MENYKIKVSNEAESKEAQELFYQLGFTWGGVFGQCVKTLKFPCVVFNSSKFLQVNYVEGSKDISSYQELTLPQLRDLVVLHRNDVKDATHKETEQGLISGADAKLAWAKGELIQIKPHDAWCDIQERATSLNIFDTPFLEFRRKPRTITLSLEIPAPFEPKDKEACFHLDYLEECGFSKLLFDSKNNAHHKFIQFGAWRTEEEIKQVVAAWRGGIKA